MSPSLLPTTAGTIVEVAFVFGGVDGACSARTPSSSDVLCCCRCAEEAVLPLCFGLDRVVNEDVAEAPLLLLALVEDFLVLVFLFGFSDALSAFDFVPPSILVEAAEPCGVVVVPVSAAPLDAAVCRALL
eukprot:CAMPEP_0183719736 /NCGR_PEP_ID=MMETSP0737-20130205/12557_1 /TAXON_ID=385413 /ORGANISM="Thalassiosira miniscula, Strain CCMP1093" /LENGTH=129 /DNA_ID=CAMNT_0025949475 /DNA_START=185 /DNA_END=571 /DNA_ORIENTATION=-